MKKFLLFYFVSALFVVGCAAERAGWKKDGASPEQTNRDYGECKKGAPGRGAGQFARGMRQAPQQGSIDSCMKEKGYSMTK